MVGGKQDYDDRTRFFGREGGTTLSQAFVLLHEGGHPAGMEELFLLIMPHRKLDVLTMTVVASLKVSQPRIGWERTALTCCKKQRQL